MRTSTRREFTSGLAQFKVIERNYHMDLNTAGKDRVSVLWRAY